MVVATVFAAAALVAAAPLVLTPAVDRRRQRVLRRLVPAVCAILDAGGIDYWADFGTLLGFHRDNDIILSDKDADVSMLASDRGPVLALADRFRAAGLCVTDRGGRSGRVLRIHERRSRYYLDIYTYTRDGAVLRSDLASPDEDIPFSLVAERVSAPFLGASIRVPRDVDAVVRFRYGDAYLTPRRNDKGSARAYSPLRSLLEDVEAGWIGIWSWLRSTVS